MYNVGPPIIIIYKMLYNICMFSLPGYNLWACETNPENKDIAQNIAVPFQKQASDCYANKDL